MRFAFCLTLKLENVAEHQVIQSPEKARRVLSKKQASSTRMSSMTSRPYSAAMRNRSHIEPALGQVVGVAYGSQQWLSVRPPRAAGAQWPTEAVL